MHYVISDIHGCLAEFQALLKKIRFSNKDILYVIGDCVDRGPDSVGVLKLMSLYDNILPIMGNHEYLFGNAAPGLFQEITEESVDSVLTEDFLGKIDAWRKNGGDTTMTEFRKLSEDDREFYLDYVLDFPLYETLSLKGRQYLLIHSLPKKYSGGDALDYAVEEILFGRPDFHGEWDQDTIIITGHTPTAKLGELYAGKIYHKGNFYDIDCGCVTGGRLAALCLETGEEFYEDSQGTYWKGRREE